MADLVFILRLVSTRAIYILGGRDGKRRIVPSNGVTSDGFWYVFLHNFSFELSYAMDVVFSVYSK